MIIEKKKLEKKLEKIGIVSNAEPQAYNAVTLTTRPKLLNIL